MTAIIGGQAWVETAPGVLTWRGAPLAVAERENPYHDGDLVALRRPVRRGGTRLLPGTVCEVLAVLDARQVTVAPATGRKGRLITEAAPLLLDVGAVVLVKRAAVAAGLGETA